MGWEAVEPPQDGVREKDRSLASASSTTFRWSALAAGTYTIQGSSVNEDLECGAQSAESKEVAID